MTRRINRSSRLTSLGLATASVLSTLGAGACTTTDDDLYQGEGVKSEDGKADSSALAVFVDASFSGAFVTDSAFDTNQAIEDQLLYSIGQLNGMSSVGRLDRLVLANVHKTTVGGRTKITYDAVLPIAWGKRNAVPASITLKLPTDISIAAVTAFTSKYKRTCAEEGAHDVDADSIWYYFRPARSGCALTAADATTVTATIEPSPINTTGKFPEFDKIWEDNQFNVVAIFGKYEIGRAHV